MNVNYQAATFVNSTELNVQTCFLHQIMINFI